MSMRFLARLRPELVRIDPPWRTFEDTARGLVAMLEAAGDLDPALASSAIAAVIAREADASTALLEIRAGVPHARLDGLGQSVVALAAAPAGLYEAVPTVQIQIVALVLSPPEPATTHLDTLAEVATLLRSEELRAGLLAAHDGGDALLVLLRHARPMP